MSSELRPERSELAGVIEDGAGQLAKWENLGCVANRRSVNTIVETLIRTAEAVLAKRVKTISQNL